MQRRNWLEFRCPRCGNKHYATEYTAEDTQIRYCHNERCGFSFDATNDFLYFKKMTETAYETAEEYKQDESDCTIPPSDIKE